MDKGDFIQHPDGRRRGSVASGIQAYAGAFALIAVSTLIGLWIAPRWGTAPVENVLITRKVRWLITVTVLLMVLGT